MAELRYIARVPWLAPSAGDPYPKGAPKWRSVQGGSTPALGEPLVAAFIPVVNTSGRLAPADPTGAPSSVDNVGWVQASKIDRECVFRIEAPATGWNGVHGVLLVLIYDQSGGLDDPAFPHNFQGQLAVLKIVVASPAGPTPISDLLPDMGEEIRRRVEELLASKSAAALNGALMRPPR
jgi:hypothetical protein